MQKLLTAFSALALAAACSEEPQLIETAEAVGSPAPELRLADANGEMVSLSDFRGKTVVLEWHNPECPFVQKHYASGNMQRTQASAASDGVVWLTINSGAPGNQGHLNGAEAKAVLAEAGASPAAYLLDPSGVAGRAFDAKTTPHMFIVNETGELVYAGGIDDKPTSDPSDIEGARNHVLAALSELKAGKPVSLPASRPYGCSVKYAAG